MIHTHLLSVCMLLCGAACTSPASQRTEAAPQPTDTLTTLTLPQIPVMLQTPEQRASYLAEHYWDHVNWADTNYIHHPEITEQGWANFINFLDIVPPAQSAAAIARLFDAAQTEQKCYRYLLQLADKYLYSPNSPLRNEEYYIAALDAVLAAPILSHTEKIRYRDRRQLAERNRLGTQALDFTYTLQSGASGRLHQLHTPYILLFFNNPGCHACGEVKDELSNSATIRRALAHKQLSLLAVYPDEDLSEWQAWADTYPREWINGYDKKQVIQAKNLYDLKAIPTLYLLDSQKKVLLKDTSVGRIEELLSR